MSYINKYLRNFKPYSLASHKVWQVSPEERRKILKLDWNESASQPSPLVKKRLLELLEEDDFFNLYPSTNNEHLIDLLASYVGLPKENVQYFGSSDSLHEYIAKLYITVGDPVLIVWPSYDNFRLTAEVSGGHVFYYNFNDDFTVSEKGLAEMIGKTEPSLVYICNPNNPTGHLFSVPFIESLLKRFTDTIFLIDEAYYEFAGPDSTCAHLVSRYDNLLVTRTMSKAFAIANFRFGYLIASAENIRYISTIRNPKNITTFAQEAAIAVLEDADYMRNYVKEVTEAKKYFIREARSLPGVTAYESRGNFVLLKFPSYEEKIAMRDFLAAGDIFVRNVEQSPSLHSCLRVTIGPMDAMERVIGRMKEYYADKNKS